MDVYEFLWIIKPSDLITLSLSFCPAADAAACFDQIAVLFTVYNWSCNHTCKQHVQVMAQPKVSIRKSNCTVNIWTEWMHEHQPLARIAWVAMNELPFILLILECNKMHVFVRQERPNSSHSNNNNNKRWCNSRYEVAHWFLLFQLIILPTSDFCFCTWTISFNHIPRATV